MHNSITHAIYNPTRSLVAFRSKSKTSKKMWPYPRRIWGDQLQDAFEHAGNEVVVWVRATYICERVANMFGVHNLTFIFMAANKEEFDLDECISIAKTLTPSHQVWLMQTILATRTETEWMEIQLQAIGHYILKTVDAHARWRVVDEENTYCLRDNEFALVDTHNDMLIYIGFDMSFGCSNNGNKHSDTLILGQQTFLESGANFTLDHDMGSGEFYITTGSQLKPLDTVIATILKPLLTTSTKTSFLAVLNTLRQQKLLKTA